MTDEARKMFVDKHNEYRSLIAKGQAKGKPGQFAPKAARMLKVNYDCNVEANAMEWAKDCTFGMNMAAMLKRWGNNMHMIPSKINNKTEAAATSVAAWFGDLQKYGVPDKNVFTMDIYTTLSKYSQNWSEPNKAAAMLSQLPLGKFAEVEDVVNAVLFLLSDASAMTTGEALPVDGGFTRM
nr:unnamed protein product [Haemonchus contortus]